MNEKKRQCPCGCGKELKKYNGSRQIVCYNMWQLLPKRIRSRIMLPSSEAEKRSAMREALKFVFKMRYELNYCISKGWKNKSIKST